MKWHWHGQWRTGRRRLTSKTNYRRAMFRPRRVLTQISVLTLMLLVGCGTAGPNQNNVTSNANQSVERTSEKGPVKLIVRATPREARLSDLVELEVVVSAKPGIEIKPPPFGQAVGDFVVRDYTERADSKSNSDSDTANTRRFVYKLEPSHSGRHLIRSVAIEFVDQRPLSEQKGVASLIESEPIEVNVTSEFGDTIPNLADLDPMLPPRPLSRSSPWGWYLFVLAICAIVALAVWWRRKKKTLATEPKRQSPEEIAHAAFTALLAENLPSKGLFKDFYLRLTGIVRNFIEGTTGLRAPEQTTEEFLQAMRSRDVFTPERSARLKEFLEAADMVKYAGQQPDSDQINISIARAREFVDYRPPVGTSDILEATLSTSEDSTGGVP